MPITMPTRPSKLLKLCMKLMDLQGRKYNFSNVNKQNHLIDPNMTCLHYDHNLR